MRLFLVDPSLGNSQSTTPTSVRAMLERHTQIRHENVKPHPQLSGVAISCRIPPSLTGGLHKRADRSVPTLDPSETAREFDNVVSAITIETIASVLGKTVWEAYARYLKSSVGVGIQDIPTHLGLVFDTLRDSFGVGGDILAKRIVRGIYAKFGAALTITEGRPLEDYVQELKDQHLRDRLGRSPPPDTPDKKGGIDG